MAAGPQRIIEIHNNDPYTLQHLQYKYRTAKKRSYDLYPCPKTLHPIAPFTGPDLAYGFINKNIVTNPYKHAGIESYDITQPSGIAQKKQEI